MPRAPMAITQKGTVTISATSRDSITTCTMADSGPMAVIMKKSQKHATSSAHAALKPLAGIGESGDRCPGQDRARH